MKDKNVRKKTIFDIIPKILTLSKVTDVAGKRKYAMCPFKLHSRQIIVLKLLKACILNLLPFDVVTP